MSKPYIFMSYSRQDRQFVELLTAKLRQAGVQTWTDLENISPGADWAQELERGLLQATALIYVASKHSGQSRWMETEYTKFMATGGTCYSDRHR
jgi:hypothetical protein